MRVAVVSPVFPPYKGGIGAVAAQDARLLRSRGVDVTVFTPRYGRDESIPSHRVGLGEGPGGLVLLKPWFAFGNAAITPSLFWQLKEFDIIHLHYPCYGMDIFAAVAALIWRKPLFVTYHMKTQAHDWRNVVFVLHRFFIEPFILAVAKKVAVSTLDYAASAGLQHKRLFELSFGVDTKRFSPGVHEELRKKYSLNEDMIGLVFVGGLDKAHYFKGLDVLLRGLSLSAENSKVRLLIVGDGSERERFEELAQKLGVRDLVHFLGGVSAEDLPDVYRAADVHILPSLDRGEAFGLVTLEAGASGLPSIVTNLPGMRMLVDPKITGERIGAGDARALGKLIDDAVEHRDTWRAMGRAARERVVRVYDEEKVADRLLEAYKGLVL